MNILIHILITVLIIHLMDLSGIDVLWALLFGILIDLDHLVKIPLYVKQNGFSVIRYWNWRTPLQEPISLLWVIPLSVYLNTFVPVLFFLSHIALDYIKGFEKKPFFPFSNYTIKHRKNRFKHLEAII